MLNSVSRTAWHVVSQNRRLLRGQQRALLADTGGRRVLEVGSGQRRGTRFFQSAVDLSHPDTDFHMTDMDPSLGHPLLDIRAPDSRLGRFDLVLCCNALEHIPELEAAVDGLAAVCEDDGVVFASTPFVYPYHDEPHDFWRPTAHGLHYIFGLRFRQVVVTWTGLRRFPFQLFVHARQPLR